MYAMNLNRVVSASSPGKVILSGEHAVVHGAPALATAVNRYTTTTINERSDSALVFNFTTFNKVVEFELNDLYVLHSRLKQRYQEFLNGSRSIAEILETPLELLLFAFVHLVEYSLIKLDFGVNVMVSSDIPIGSGMGSSAAAIVSLLHAMNVFFNMNLSTENYLTLGVEVENLRHGHASGIDICLAIHGGAVRFQKGCMQPISLPEFSVPLINTGIPVCSTGESVFAVLPFFRENVLIEQFAQVTELLESSLKLKNHSLIIDAICLNHELLTYICVVPERVQNFVKEIETRRGAAKVCGAGAIRGDNAGIIWVVCGENIRDIVEKYGYEILQVKSEPYGMRIL